IAWLQIEQKFGFARLSWDDPSEKTNRRQIVARRATFCWFMTCSVLLLLDQVEGRLDHLRRCQPVLLVEVFGDVSRLAEFTAYTQRVHAMANARPRQRVRNLRAHA